MPGTADQVAIDGTPTNGANPWIDSLVWGGAWADSIGLATSSGPVTISWTAMSGADPNVSILPEHTAINYGGYTWFNYEIAALEQAFSTWEAVASLEFVQSAAQNSDVWVWLMGAGDANGAAGWSTVPGLGWWDEP